MSDNLLILSSVVFLLLAGLCVPILLQILRAAKEMSLTLKVINQRLPLIMKNLEEISTNISQASTTVHRQVAEISLILNRIQGIFGVIFGLEEQLRRRMSFPFARTLRTCMAVAKGTRVFIDRLTGDCPEGKEGSGST